MDLVMNLKNIKPQLTIKLKAKDITSTINLYKEDQIQFKNFQIL